MIDWRDLWDNARFDITRKRIIDSLTIDEILDYFYRKSFLTGFSLIPELLNFETLTEYNGFLTGE